MLRLASFWATGSDNDTLDWAVFLTGAGALAFALVLALTPAELRLTEVSEPPQETTAL